jgi:hypothetical protein
MPITLRDDKHHSGRPSQPNKTRPPNYENQEKKTFLQGTKVTEAEFHDELETHLRADPELGGRLTRRDPVVGGFDDLLHDDVISELKVNPPRSLPATVDKSVKYLGQRTQYGVGRGSQLSVLVVLDQSAKKSPPGVIDNYIGWLRPKLHGLEDARYPSLVGVLIINANLPLPSGWRRRIPLEADDDPEGSVCPTRPRRGSQAPGTLVHLADDENVREAARIPRGAARTGSHRVRRPRCRAIPRPHGLQHS